MYIRFPEEIWDNDQDDENELNDNGMEVKLIPNVIAEIPMGLVEYQPQFEEKDNDVLKSARLKGRL